MDIEKIEEQAKYIDQYLEILYKSCYPISLAEGIENKQLPSSENKEKFKTLEYILEELDLVEFVRGRDNSTLSGQCEYKISLKGRELIEEEGSSLELLLAREFRKIYPLPNKKEWEEFYNPKLEKRASQADFFLDLLISENVINLDKDAIRTHFKRWFKENHELDLQIKNGSMVIEDGAIQLLPDFKKDNIPDFIKWFNSEKDQFINYLKANGISIEKNIKNKTINMVINENSTIKRQSNFSEESDKVNIWNKTNVIIALIVGIVTIIGIVWNIIKNTQ